MISSPHRRVTSLWQTGVEPIVSLHQADYRPIIRASLIYNLFIRTCFTSACFDEQSVNLPVFFGKPVFDNLLLPAWWSSSHQYQFTVWQRHRGWVELVVFYIPLDTWKVILETSLFRQLIALILATEAQEHEQLVMRWLGLLCHAVKSTVPRWCDWQVVTLPSVCWSSRQRFCLEMSLQYLVPAPWINACCACRLLLCAVLLFWRAET